MRLLRRGGGGGGATRRRGRGSAGVAAQVDDRGVGRDRRCRRARAGREPRRGACAAGADAGGRVGQGTRSSAVKRDGKRDAAASSAARADRGRRSSGRLGEVEHGLVVVDPMGVVVDAEPELVGPVVVGTDGALVVEGGAQGLAEATANDAALAAAWPQPAASFWARRRSSSAWRASTLAWRLERVGAPGGAAPEPRPGGSGCGAGAGTRAGTGGDDDCFAAEHAGEARALDARGRRRPRHPRRGRRWRRGRLLQPSSR